MPAGRCSGRNKLPRPRNPRRRLEQQSFIGEFDNRGLTAYCRCMETEVDVDADLLNGIKSFLAEHVHAQEICTTR